MKYDLLKLAELADSTSQKVFAEALRWAHGEMIKSTRPEIDDDFHRFFWPRYPNKTGKPAAIRAWAVARKKAPMAAILSGLERWLDYWRARNQPQFIPHPSTWLNQERWNDQPPTTPGGDDADRLQEDAARRLGARVNGHH